MLTPKTIVTPVAVPSALTTEYTVGTTVAGVTRLLRVTLYYVNQAKTAAAWITAKKGGMFVASQQATRVDGRLEAMTLGICESGSAIAVQGSDATSIHHWIDAIEVR